LYNLREKILLRRSASCAVFAELVREILGASMFFNRVCTVSRAMPRKGMHWKTALAVCVLLLQLAASWTIAVAQPCPEDLYAVEAVFPAEVKLKIALLGAFREVSPGVYAFRSGYDERVVVALYHSPAPPLGTMLPTVRFQVPVEGGKPIFNVSGGELCRVVKLEIDRLVAEGVLEGLRPADAEGLAAACSAGKAGWEKRLVLCNGTWLSYDEVPGASPLLGCRVPLPLGYAEIPIWTVPRQPPLWLVAAAAVAALILALSWKRFKGRRSASST